jgi:hypothetical protein
MHLATRTDSSSLLALGARQKAIFGMEESGALQVPIKRLDACLSSPLPRPVLLKIDVQGFELEVLKGATDLLPEIDAVYVEASYIELYEGQALHHEIERFLEEQRLPLRGTLQCAPPPGRAGAGGPPVSTTIDSGRHRNAMTPRLA